MTSETQRPPRPNPLLGGAVALGILAVAALLSGPLFGPAPSPTPAATVPSIEASASPDRWAALRRPIALPALDPDGSCPTTDEIQDDSGLAPRPDPGSVQPLGAFHGGRLYYDPENARWNNLSLLWVTRDVQPFDALVRGRRLDGSPDGQPDLGFGDRLDPLMEMHLVASDSEPIGTVASLIGWKLIHGDVTRVRRSGCYAVQIDTTAASEVFVFEATYALEAVAELRARPLDPTAVTEASCDRIRPRDITLFARGALGDGPAYLVWQAFQGRPESGEIPLSTLESRDGWYALPVAPWLISPRDRGPMVIRSVGPHGIGFGGPGIENDVEVLPVTSTIHGDEGAGWRAFFSNMWVREPGCYGLRVDTISGSDVFPAFSVVP